MSAGSAGTRGSAGFRNDLRGVRPHHRADSRRHRRRGARARQPGHQYGHRRVRRRAASQVADFIGAIEDLGYGVPETDGAARRRGAGLPAAAAGGRRLRGAGDGAGHVAPAAPWLQLALTLPVIFYSGAPFYTAAWTRAAPPLGQHELADRAGHGRGVPLLALGDAARRPRGLLRSRGGDHRADPDWAARWKRARAARPPRPSAV